MRHGVAEEGPELRPLLVTPMLGPVEIGADALLRLRVNHQRFTATALRITRYASQFQFWWRRPTVRAAASARRMSNGTQPRPLSGRLVPVIHRGDPCHRGVPLQRLTQRRAGGACGLLVQAGHTVRLGSLTGTSRSRSPRSSSSI